MGISDGAVNRMSAAMMEWQYSLHTEMPPAGEVQAEGYRRLSGREAGVTAEPSIDGLLIKMLRATPGRIRLPPDGWGAPGYIGAYTPDGTTLVLWTETDDLHVSEFLKRLGIAGEEGQKYIDEAVDALCRRHGVPTRDELEEMLEELG